MSLRSFKTEDEAPRVALPSVLGDDDDQDLEELDVAMDNLNTGPSDKAQLEEGLISLSALPRSKWQTLLNLDTIKVSLVAQSWSVHVSLMSTLSLAVAQQTQRST